MTSITNYRPYYEVLSRVDKARSRLRSVLVMEGLFILLTTLCGAVLVTTLAQGYIRFGMYGRLALLILGGAAVLYVFWRYVLAPLRYDPGDKEVARFLETRLPELGNSLINTLLLTEEAEFWSPVLVERAVTEAAAGARDIDLLAAVSDRRAKRWGLCAAIAVTLLAAFVVLGYGRFSSAALQILMPFEKIASVGDVEFKVSPGTIAVVKGEPLDISAVLKNPGGKPHEGFIEIAEAGVAKTVRKDLLCTGDKLERFSYRVSQVLQPFTYMVSVGGTESEVFKVTLREPPLIERIDAVYKYPEYTGLAPQKVDGVGGEIRCLIGTTVEMTVRVSSPIEGGSVAFGRGEVLNSGRRADDGRSVTFAFTVLQNDTYQVHLAGQMPDGTAAVYRITALEDKPPAIQFTVPNRDAASAPGESVKMSLKASDDYGLGEVRLMAQSDKEETPRVVTGWKKFADIKDALIDYVFVVDPGRYKLGQTILYWAEAYDRRTYQGGNSPRGPNVTQTAKFKIVVEDRKAAAAEKLTQLSRLYDRLREILKMQEDARVTTSTVAATKKQAEVRTGGQSLEKAQKAVRDGTLAVVKEVSFDSDTVAIKETLEVLTSNEMASAITKAKALADLAEPSRMAARGDLSKTLAGDQDTIIAVLRRILDIANKLADAVKEEAKRLDPSDLPPDVLNKLKNLKDKLKEFAAEQKKV
ncbi:MAG: hypothetical protein NT049_00770, partial [Planctomycetota bacterium]|nr:hypothetical protein [Planctomycetota bacterium]